VRVSTHLPILSISFLFSTLSGAVAATSPLRHDFVCRSIWDPISTHRNGCITRARFADTLHSRYANILVASSYKWNGQNLSAIVCIVAVCYIWHCYVQRGLQYIGMCIYASSSCLVGVHEHPTATATKQTNNFLLFSFLIVLSFLH
jgi:hypothetical protein